ncbi:MAG: TonB-dependent receptor [Spirochaetales bacterium]|nr:TonB-dependent receptor [Spirochaetales bacterium]
MLKKQISQFFLIFVLSFFIVFLVAAQDENDSVDEDDSLYTVIMDDIVIEENTEEEILYTTREVTVFTKEDIKKSGAKNVVDVVEMAPGVTVSRQGGVLEPQKVSIRGGETRHVLVLIDGKPADSVWTGGVDLSSIPLDSVERIEVIRGAAAAIYGEGAVSGVINIITKKDSAQKLSTSVEYGFASFNTHQLNTSLSGPFGKESGWSGSFNAGGLYTGGGYEYQVSDSTVERLNNDGWSANASGQLGWDKTNIKTEKEPDVFDSFKLNGSFYMSQRGAPGIMEFLTPNAEIDNIRASGGSSVELDAEKAGTISININGAYISSEYSNPDDDVDDCNNDTSIDAGVSWVSNYDVSGVYITINTNAGYNFNYLYSTALTDSAGSSVDGDAFQHTASLHTNSDIIAGNFDFTPALGIDWYLDDYASMELDPDFAFTWSASGGWAPFRSSSSDGPFYIKLNAGTAYKNPSFQDLFWPQGAFAAGNSDLEPEKSFSTDLGLSYNFTNNEVFNAGIDISGFFSHIDDLIQWMPSAGGVWRPSNVGMVYSGGTELSGKLIFTKIFGWMDIDFNLVYNWLKCVDADSDSVNYGKQLAYRPEHSGNVSILFTIIDKFTIDFSGKYIGYRFTNNANTKYLDDVIILSTSLGMDITDFFHISATADNLLNQSYVDRLGYPVPGFEFGIKGRLSL